MNRPRIAAIVSAAAASTAAFSVVSRSSLLGTLAGAALVPVIYTLVSHFSSAGLDHAGEWLRGRTSRGATHEDGRPVASEETRPALGAPLRLAEADPDSDAVVDSGAAQGRGRHRPASRTQWLLVGSTMAALAVSIYAVASPQAAQTIEKVVVQRQVIEKTITVTEEVESPGPAVYAVHTPVAGTSATDISTATASTTTASTADAPGTDTSAGAESTADTPAADTSGVDGSTATTSPVTAEAPASAPMTATEPGQAGQEAGSSLTASTP